MTTGREQFTQILYGLAKMHRLELADFLFARYLEQLEPLGYERVNPILLSYADKMKFPIIDDIKKKLGCEPVDALSDDEKSRIIAAKVIKAVSAYGYTNPKAAREYIGDDGWRMLHDITDWQSLCDNLTAEREQTFAAQFREYIKAAKHDDKREQWEQLQSASCPALVSDTLRGLCESKNSMTADGD